MATPVNVPTGKGCEDDGPSGGAGGGGASTSNANVPKPKRLACLVCRKRKLRCDGSRPSCFTCTRLGHLCAYDEVKRKSGPKRGYVKALEDRLKQVEFLLKANAPASARQRVSTPPATKSSEDQLQPPVTAASFNAPAPSAGVAVDYNMKSWSLQGECFQPAATMNDFNFAENIPTGMNGVDNSTFTWDMIGLGLEEPLPPQDVMDELHHIYFDKVHPSMPVIHKLRYLSAMNLAPNQRPPVALRYAMWTLGSSITGKYVGLKDIFYQRARKYIEADCAKGSGESMTSVAHAQTYVLLSSYEFKMMHFPRAWMSTGSAVRICQMLGLHRLDGTGLDVKQCLPPPRDWTEKEERRRTFWMAFSEDRYASIGTGWPMSIDERDIMTNLPASEEAFAMGRPETTTPLPEAMNPAGAGKLSSFGGVVLMACLFGRNLVHLHRPHADNRDHDLNGEFWKRHRNMDNILLNTSLCLPEHLRLPCGLSNPNIVFTNMNIHTSTICLHQAAISAVDKNRLPASVSAESKIRCITAANEIASIMRMASHLDLSTMNPFTSFCLYVAARVFVQYLKSRPDDSQTIEALRFLLAAMSAMKQKNPLTGSFLVQLDVDLEALSMRIPKLKNVFPRNGDGPGTKTPEAKSSQGNTCGFLVIGEDDDASPANGADIMELSYRHHNSSSTAARPGFDTSNYHTTMDASGGYLDRQSSGTHELSSSPHLDGQSNGPTPSPSGAPSEQHRTGSKAAESNSSRASFGVSPTQPLGTQAELDAAAAAAFFPMDTSDFGMPGGGDDYAAPDGWDVPGSTGPGVGSGCGNAMLGHGGDMTLVPVAEGVVQQFMNMQPMEAMDLGWGCGV